MSRLKKRKRKFIKTNSGLPNSESLKKIKSIASKGIPSLIAKRPRAKWKQAPVRRPSKKQQKTAFGNQNNYLPPKKYDTVLSPKQPPVSMSDLQQAMRSQYEPLARRPDPFMQNYGHTFLGRTILPKGPVEDKLRMFNRFSNSINKLSQYQQAVPGYQPPNLAPPGQPMALNQNRALPEQVPDVQEAQRTFQESMRPTENWTANEKYTLEKDPMFTAFMGDVIARLDSVEEKDVFQAMMALMKDKTKMKTNNLLEMQYSNGSSRDFDFKQMADVVKRLVHIHDARNIQSDMYNFVKSLVDNYNNMKVTQASLFTRLFGTQSKITNYNDQKILERFEGVTPVDDSGPMVKSDIVNKGKTYVWAKQLIKALRGYKPTITKTERQGMLPTADPDDRGGYIEDAVVDEATTGGASRQIMRSRAEARENTQEEQGVPLEPGAMVKSITHNTEVTFTRPNSAVANLFKDIYKKGLLRWNEKGEIIAQGKILEDSNIKEIVKYIYAKKDDLYSKSIGPIPQGAETVNKIILENALEAVSDTEKIRRLLVKGGIHVFKAGVNLVSLGSKLVAFLSALGITSTMWLWIGQFITGADAATMNNISDHPIYKAVNYKGWMDYVGGEVLSPVWRWMSSWIDDATDGDPARKSAYYATFQWVKDNSIQAASVIVQSLLNFGTLMGITHTLRRT